MENFNAIQEHSKSCKNMFNCIITPWLKVDKQNCCHITVDICKFWWVFAVGANPHFNHFKYYILYFIKFCIPDKIKI